MKRNNVVLRTTDPILDIVSFGRSPRILTSREIAEVRLTVHGAPEVVVKVSGGARTLSGVIRHVNYIGRKGKLDMETDSGDVVRRRGFGEALIQDWDLDIEAYERFSHRLARNNRKPPKLVHNIIFSMPPTTSAPHLLLAVKAFAMREWGLEHRYAMALHTDEPHPHVHVVVKAMSEQGRRLNVHKDTLQRWRQAFARELQKQRIDAKATSRPVRGKVRKSYRDGVFRANARGESTHVRRWSETSRVQRGPKLDRGKEKMLRTRDAVVRGYAAIEEQLRRQQEFSLADRVFQFVRGFDPVRTQEEIFREDGHQRCHDNPRPSIASKR